MSTRCDFQIGDIRIRLVLKFTYVEKGFNIKMWHGNSLVYRSMLFFANAKQGINRKMLESKKNSELNLICIINPPS